jgi:hypothetical protein
MHWSEKIERSGNQGVGRQRQKDMIRSRRLALVAIVLTFGVAACGDPSGSGSGSTAPSSHTPKVIQLAGSQGATTERAPAAAMPTAGAADSKIAFMGTTKFVYDGALPALDGSAPSWSFAPGQKADPQQIAKLAASLGVKGEVRTLPQDQGGGWAVGPEDYSGPVLTVGSDGMLSWWLSSAQVAMGSGCAVAGGATDGGIAGTAVIAPTPAVTAPAATPDSSPPVTTTVIASPPDCAAPQPPAGVPTKDEALAKAKQLFAAWGYDVNSYQFDDPYADEWNAGVNASLMVGGMKAPITLSVSFGANGAVTYASGSLAVPQQGADYPTVGAAKGLERLKTQQFQYLGVGGGGGVMKAATDQVVATPETVAPATTGIAAPGVAAIAPICMPDTNVPMPPVDATAPTGVTVTAPAIVDCGNPTPAEPVTVTLNSVKRDLTMVWADDGTIWLLPAYTFGSADGGIYTVIAVADEFIQQPVVQPATTEPVPDTVLIPVPDTVLIPNTSASTPTS